MWRGIDNVRVEVIDRRGWYVFNLRKDDFVVYEDGKPQQILTFTTEITDPNSPGIGYMMGFYPEDPRRDGRPRMPRVRVRDGKARGLKAHCHPSAYTLDPDEPHQP